MSLEEWATMFGEDYQTAIDSYVETIRSSLENSLDDDTLNSFMSKYMPDETAQRSFEEAMKIMVQYRTSITHSFRRNGRLPEVALEYHSITE